MKMRVVIVKISALLFISSVLVAANAYALMGGLRWKGTFETEPTEIKWEYRIVPLSATAAIQDGSFEQELNDLGAQGWELQTVIVTQNGGYYILKKPRSA